MQQLRDRSLSESKNTPAAPIPGCEWHLTDRCNYRCSYCCESQGKRGKHRLGHASDAVIDAVLELLEQQESTWLVKFAGGEETVHPRFERVWKRVADMGHDVAITTNFSFPLERWERLLDATGERLSYITASLHLEQVDVGRFIKKVIAVNRHPAAHDKITVTSVVTEDNFKLLSEAWDTCSAADVPMELARLKIDGSYVGYSPKIEETLAHNGLNNVDKLRDFDSYGTMCLTGHDFFIIKPDGHAYRCFTQPGQYNCLGNVLTGTFRLYGGARPCLSHKCTCTVPANRNLILFENRASWHQVQTHKLAALKQRLVR
ncbi:MAG: radical SAM protein [Planctomycetota bacterium]